MSEAVDILVAAPGAPERAHGPDASASSTASPNTASPVPSAPRMYELDLLRIVAALLVLLYHYTVAANDVGASKVVFPDWLTQVSRYGFLGVEMFFFISGMIILRSASDRSARAFATGRIVRLYPAYWCAVLVTFAVLRLWGGWYPVSFGDLLANLTMLQSFMGRPGIDGAYWTLGVELLFYVIIWTVLRTGLRDHLRAVLAGWLLLSICLEPSPSQAAQVWLGARWAPFFVAGAALAFLQEDRRDVVAWVLLVVAGSASVGGALLHTIDQGNPAGAEPLVSAVIVAVMLLVVAAVGSGRLRSIGRPWMAVAGTLSYPLYLIHAHIGYTVLNRLGGVNRWILLGGLVLGALCAAWALHRAERVVAGRLRMLVRPAPDAGVR